MHIKDDTMKLRCSEAIGGIQPKRLKENVYFALNLGRDKQGLFTVGLEPC